MRSRPPQTTDNQIPVTLAVTASLGVQSLCGGLAPQGDIFPAWEAVGVDVHRGWFRMYRKLGDSWISKSPAALSVFWHLLSSAAWTDKEGELWNLKAGQCDLTQEQLAERCGLGRQQIRGVLGKLERVGTIKRETIGNSTNRRTIVTIVNWAAYQQVQPTSNQEPTNGQPTSNQEPTSLKELEEGKKVKELQEPSPRKRGVVYDENFEYWFSRYPKRAGKGAAWKVWQRMPDTDKAGAIEAVQIFTETWASAPPDRMQYCPHPATWLNQRRWEDDPKTWEQQAKGNSNGTKTSRRFANAGDASKFDGLPTA